jgi:hypothetical protein
MKTISRTPILLAVLVLFLAVIACGTQTAPQVSNNNGSQNTQNTQRSAPVTSAAISGDPQTTVTNILSDFTKAPPYHVTMTVTTDTSTLNMSADVILPDRFHITTERQGTTSEMLIVGDKSYNKVNGQWVASSLDIGSLTASFADGLSKDTTISNVKFVKSDTINGQPTSVYTFDSHYAVEGLTIDSSTTMWIDTSNGLPVKMQIDSNAAGIQSHTEQSIEYDPSIIIEAPTQ